MRFSFLDICVGLSVLMTTPIVMFVYGWNQPQPICAISLLLAFMATLASSWMTSEAGDDPDAPIEVASLADEFEATGVIAHLANHGIKAFPVGSFVSGFQVEAPRDVKVVVARKDVEVASQILAEINLEDNEVDWSNVDVGRREL